MVEQGKPTDAKSLQELKQAIIKEMLIQRLSAAPDSLVTKTVTKTVTVPRNHLDAVEIIRLVEVHFSRHDGASEGTCHQSGVRLAAVAIRNDDTAKRTIALRAKGAITLVIATEGRCLFLRRLFAVSRHDFRFRGGVVPQSQVDLA